jgi:outer membrane lipoprotein SlyB
LLAIPGIGPLIAAGPIAAGITGAILGGSFGGVAGSLVGLGLSKAEAHLVEQHLKAGKTILMVEDEERGDELRVIFANAGAVSNALK